MLKKPYEIGEHHKLFFGTLTNGNRFRIANLLLKVPKTVTQISKNLKINQTTVSHNLKRMLRCGFVTNSLNGKFRVYSINKETIAPLIKLMNKHVVKYCKCKTHRKG